MSTSSKLREEADDRREENQEVFCRRFLDRGGDDEQLSPLQFVFCYSKKSELLEYEG